MSQFICSGKMTGYGIYGLPADRASDRLHVACLAGGGAPQFFDSFVSRREKLRASGATAAEITASLDELEQRIRTILADPDNIEDVIDWSGR
jgi:hypothetical protein